MSPADAPSLADPILPADAEAAARPPERVNYATGMLLDAADFRDEQSYHRGRLAAALRALHGYGTVAGLRVREPAEGDGTLELRVEPGLAIDRLGRLLELRAPWCIRLARWFEGQETGLLRSILNGPPQTRHDPSAVVDVFIEARSCETALAPAFATGPFDGRDAVAAARLAETPRLSLVPRREGGAIPSPTNHAPAPGASAEDQLRFVLAAWEPPTAQERLPEQIETQDPTAVLLARVAIPVVLDDDPPDARPRLDLAQRVEVDNGLRPFIAPVGRWAGRAAATEPLVTP
jgi:hypothetical protein